MQKSATLDELDLALINALQIAPRAPWVRVAKALEVDPVTAARRWDRLTREGHAWVTAYGAPPLMRETCYAHVSVVCETGRIDEVAAELAKDPHAVTIEHTTGSCDLFVCVWTTDMNTFSTYLVNRIARIPGVISTSTAVTTEMYLEGSSWRVRALDARQREQMQTVAARSSGPSVLREEDRPLVVELSNNARASYEDLAAHVNTPVATVRRRVQRIMASGLLVLRCEVSRSASGWPVESTLWINVPPVELDRTAQALAALPETRSCAAVVGKANLALTVWLRSVADLHRLEMTISERSSAVTIVDRLLVLRYFKLMGRVLGKGGRAVANVPMDIWRAPV